MPKVRLLCVVLASLFVVVAPGSVIAAPPLFQAHDSFTETFPDAVCGIEGTSVVKGVDNFQLSANNTFRDDFTLDQTFTATDSQKSIVIHVADQVTGLDAPIDNGDGTVTFVTTFKGVPEQLRIENGPLLLVGAGVITFTDTYAVDADGNFTFVSETVSGQHGPHPEAASDFTLHCALLIPALS